MKKRKPHLFFAAVALVTALLGCTTAFAQTAPTPTHTFQPTGTTGVFGTNTNWSLSTLPTTSSHVLIADGKTATMSQTDANTLFGSLTLGVNSTINLAATLKQGPAAGSVIYFNNGSHLNYTSGDVNRAATYNILSGATARLTLSATTAGDSLPQGSLVGDSTTTVNYDVVNLTNARWNASAFNGTLNFNTNLANNARAVNFANAANLLGSGITNIGTFVRVTGSKSNLMNDSGTLQLTGSSGGASNVKFDMGASTDTIGNFVIASPTGATASAPTLRGSNTAFTVSGTTTFQGTAGDVNFDSSNATPSNHNLITTGNMTFGGTGTWAVAGDGRINLNAASGTRTITTNTNASIANTLVGSQGFTKQGTGTLTLTGTNVYTGGTNINAGMLAFANGSLGTIGNITFGGNSALRWASSNTQDVSGRIVMSNSVISTFDTNGNDVSFFTGIGSSTSGSLTKTGVGKLTLQAIASYTGITTISDGTLEIWSSLASSGIVNNAALIFDNALSQSYINAISGSGTFTKKGAGMLTLSAANTYTGATQVTGGALNIASTGSTDVNSAVTVSNSGSAIIVNGTLGGSLLAEAGTTVSGSGTITGNTTISGIHNPGNSPGIQAYASNLTYSGGLSVVNWELNANTSTNLANPDAIFDQIIVGGNLSFSGSTALNLVFNGSGSAVNWADAFWDSNQSWTLYDVAGNTENFVNLNLNISDWLDSGGNLFSTTGGSFSLGQSGQDVVLNYVIPEPGAALLGGLGVLLLLRRRR